MGSTDKPADPETAKEVPPPPPTESYESTPPPPKPDFFVVEAVLRFLVFAASLTSVLVIVTSKQTLFRGPFKVAEAKFNHSPAFIYFVVALAVAGLYAILTLLASISVLWKPIVSTKFLLHFAFWDVLILGLVASATGAAGGVAYIGYKGNEHTRWPEVCSNFDKFCQHIAGALATSLFASVLLVLLVWLSTFNLHRKIPK